MTDLDAAAGGIPEADRLDTGLGRDVLARMGLDAAPAADRGGLATLYRAWCRSVNFDNARKLIALSQGDPTLPLPGGHARDFFDHWLEYGAGGTCWPSSNGLYMLLRHCGFEARRISASMMDVGQPNHGSVVVRVDDDDWLADSSILTDEVLPLRRESHTEMRHPVHGTRVEPVGDSFRIAFAHTTTDEGHLPCGLLEDPVDHAFYLDRYEASREMSPFNNKLTGRRNRDAGVVTLVGKTRYWKTARGIEKSELERDELAASLVADLGFSEALVTDLADAGVLG